ncbi:Chromosome partition protein Smc [Corynebacterium kalinowskii]|uniref:Chromosome partition protein Smc n=1 Tax=Corynebacterium kalinowskii TaxID=2675216 RepID=A0A6B8VD66_9CORY|nr:ATP-binding protein [Corynebacterium kalinowskii]QGU00989.1 Chromosome partition protein Smc [Corynebacterium kalinowskii]
MITGQFRLETIQVHNWGTFDGLHSVEVARAGYLITGPSGSGKSTLIDAVSTILVPPAKLKFNAAADAGASSGRDLVTYCRGAWRREHSGEADELTRSYLRAGATWSGVLLRYSDGAGNTVSACRLMYLSSKAYANQDIVNLFLILPREADLQEFEQLAVDGLNITTAKKQFVEALSVQRQHPPFVAALRRQLGIADEGALELLHRTQSAKTLGDLNYLMRNFMLPVPETFSIARQAVENFTELQTAYATVVNAREQIDHLAPVRNAALELEKIAAQMDELAADKEGLPAFVYGRKQSFAQAELEQFQSELTAVEAVHTALSAKIIDLNSERERISTLIHGEESSGLVAATAERDKAAEQLQRTRRAENDFAIRLADIAATMPGSVEEFANLRLQLEQDLIEVAARSDKDQSRLEAVIGDLRELQNNRNARTTEMQAIRKFQSTMDSRLLNARALIAEITGIREKDLPFVADLISISSDHLHWQGAAERVMGGFARKLLVPEEHYSLVSAAVNENHLSAKLQYVRFNNQLENSKPSSFVPGTLGTKIEVKSGKYHDWIQSQLSVQFDFECCETMEQFRASRRAITVHGQVKYSATEHVKDDRSRIDDRSRWVLSGNLDDKYEELQSIIAGLKRDIALKEMDRDRIKSGLVQATSRSTTVQRLLETMDFAVIDVLSAQVALDAAQRIVDELTDGNQELALLKKQQSKNGAALEVAKTKLERNLQDNGRIQESIDRAEKLLEDATSRLAANPTPSETVEARLDQRCMAIDRSIRQDNIDRLHSVVMDELSAELNSLHNRRNRQEGNMVNAMQRYLDKWPQRRGDLTAEFTWQGDFLTELERLESDDLPRFEQRFREMLQEQTNKHLGRLRRLIRDAASKTRNSIQMINDSLAAVDFYPGTHLQIEVRDAQPAIARDFVALLDDALEGILTEPDVDESERRFHKLKVLIEAVEPSDKTTSRERRLRLDTREHVKFLGVEYGADGVRGAVYDSAEGLSGGQAQKLSSFCLAAALRYRLTGMGLPASQAKKSIVEDSENVYPKYGTIILDEAFDRADAEFTRAAMDAFGRFGFHMILATPEKLLQTVQDYIGGVLMVECPDRKRSRTSALTILEVRDENT